MKRQPFHGVRELIPAGYISIIILIIPLTSMLTDIMKGHLAPMTTLIFQPETATQRFTEDLSVRLQNGNSRARIAREAPITISMIDTEKSKKQGAHSKRCAFLLQSEQVE